MVNYVYQLISPRVISVKYENLDLDDKVIVKPLYMAICHADQRYYTGNRDKKILSKKLPMALIHECCGEVVIDKSGKFKKGQKVVLIPNVPGKYNDEIYENYGEGAKFLSSGYDGFMREYINLSVDRVVPFKNIPLEIAAITEFISVSIHAIERFKNVSHSNKDTIGVWGDGSLAFVTANVLKKEFPNSQIIVFGKNRDKLSLFSFIDKTILIDNIPQDLKIDHAFECVGGEGSFYAIDDIIRCIKPQGTILLMGVSENRIGINTRDILEKGLTFVGSSRSSYQDFVRAVEILQDEKVQKRLKLIIENYGVVKKIEDIHKVFNFDLNTPFKTVFRWEI
jgi:ribitol-5-phosphate 2-dehydrogenase